MLITVEKVQCIAFIFDRILGHDTSGWDLHKYCNSLFCQMPFYYCTYMLLPNSAPTSNCILSQNYNSCRLNTVGKYKTKLDSYLGWTNHHYFHLIRHGVSRGCSEYVIVSFSSPITTLVSLLLVFPPYFERSLLTTGGEFQSYLFTFCGMPATAGLNSYCVLFLSFLQYWHGHIFNYFSLC